MDIKLNGIITHIFIQKVMKKPVEAGEKPHEGNENISEKQINGIKKEVEEDEEKKNSETAANELLEEMKESDAEKSARPISSSHIDEPVQNGVCVMKDKTSDGNEEDDDEEEEEVILNKRI